MDKEEFWRIQVPVADGTPCLAAADKPDWIARIEREGAINALKVERVRLTDELSDKTEEANLNTHDLRELLDKLDVLEQHIPAA